MKDLLPMNEKDMMKLYMELTGAKEDQARGVLMYIYPESADDRQDEFQQVLGATQRRVSPEAMEIIDGLRESPFEKRVVVSQPQPSPR